MSNSFTARGNLAAAPELKTVTVNGENRQVAEMRMYCDRPIPDGDGGFKDKGGFWLNVSRWGAAAEHAARVLDKGFRIKAEGTLVQNSWEKDGEKFSRLELTADDITLDLSRVESVTRRERRSPNATDTADSTSEDAAEAVAYDD
ncbi:MULTISPECIES: single-stranded DNA-binding protein [Salinisphaera]|uniref:Single-stranded DNA-binding protein n=1 Tax=Salinisphaera hydrothermalis (strain C41B8) TaxID=1304275 RepID=A0A084IJ22_SALHC|nr:single-stranded DNA-binding protein [Salinisphaera hydrothermalis]KEZ76706.1 single-stranded DNA binding protein-like protein [Salinisphaera hydrothermalis C41B8]|tara:strand:+ start:22 stop:456 length:435 start_codon:yes stop_codon:yes gene_type:complete